MQYLNIAATALMVGQAVALPQGLDWSAIEDPTLAAVPSADIPVVAPEATAAATTVSYAPSAAAASVSAAVSANPSDTSLKIKKRVDNSNCGANTPADDDTSDAFLACTTYNDEANNAPTPSGYDLVYSAQAGSSQGVYGYMGYSVLDTYDTNTCASRCNSVKGCSSFNICKLTTALTPSENKD